MQLPMPFFRIDRLATLYFFQLFQGMPLRTNSGIPILMYHSISNEAEPDRHPYYQTVTSPAVFAEHMRFLRENDYSVINVNDAPTLIGTPARTKKPVVITFDDGYRDFYTHAFPVLQRYGFTATVFLPTQYIGDASLTFKGRDCLTWAEVRDLHAAGIQFGSHTVSHPQLWGLAQSDVERELLESKLILEDKLASQVRSFAYPYAFPEQDARFAYSLRATLQACGYDVGVSTILGCAHVGDDTWFLPRLPVNSFDDYALFRAKLAGAYDWLHVPQYVGKLAKRRPAANLANQFSPA